MNEKQLTRAIEEGIDNSFPARLLEVIVYIIMGLGILYIIITLISLIVPDCLDTGECAMAEQLCPNGNRNLDCYVIDKDLERKAISCDESGACGGIRPIVMEWNGCGYQEANAWFEQYKNKVGGNLYLECN